MTKFEFIYTIWSNNYSEIKCDKMIITARNYDNAKEIFNDITSDKIVTITQITQIR